MSYTMKNTNRAQISLTDYHMVDEVTPNHIVELSDQLLVKFLKYYYEYEHTDELYYEIIFQEDSDIIEDIIFHTKASFDKSVIGLSDKDLQRFKIIPKSATHLIHEIINTRDVASVDEDLLSNIQYEVLLGEEYLEGFKDKRNAIRFSNNMYRSKGTLYSIQQFFKMFYGTTVEVSYPKENVFIVGHAYDKEKEYKNYMDYQNHSIRIKLAYEELGETGVGDRLSPWAQFLLKSPEYPSLDPNDVPYRGNTSGSNTVITPSQDLDRFEDFLDNPYTYYNKDFINNNIFKSTVNYPDIGIEPFDYRIKNFINTSASDIGYESQKFITNDKLYQMYSILVKSSIGYSDWVKPYKAFVHPAGMYIGSQLEITTEVDLTQDITMFDYDDLPNNITSAYIFGISSETDITGIVDNLRIELPGSVVYYNNTEYNAGLPLEDGVTLEQIDRTYDNIAEFIQASSKTFDEDSDLSLTHTDMSENAEGLSTFDEVYYPYIDPLDQIYIDENGQYTLDENGNKIYLP